MEDVEEEIGLNSCWIVVPGQMSLCYPAPCNLRLGPHIVWAWAMPVVTWNAKDSTQTTSVSLKSGVQFLSFTPRREFIL